MSSSAIKWGDEKTYKSFLIAALSVFEMSDATPAAVNARMRTMNYTITDRAVEHKLNDVKRLARRLKNGEDISDEPILNGNTSGKPRVGGGATASKKRKAKEPAVATSDSEDSEEEAKPAKKTKRVAAPVRPAEPAKPAAKKAAAGAEPKAVKGKK